MNEQRDVLGELVGDGGEDVSAEGAEDGAFAADAHEECADVVGGGEVEDGIGDVGADDVDGDHGDVVLFAHFGGEEEGFAGLWVFVEAGALGVHAELDVDLADEEDEEDAVELFGVAGGEVEESFAAAGGDHDVGA